HSGYNAPASHPEEKQNGRNTSVCQLKYHTQTINYTHAQIGYIQKQINMDISAHLPDCVCEIRVYSHTHTHTQTHRQPLQRSCCWVVKYASACPGPVEQT